MAVESYGPQIAAVTYTFLILSTIATILRIYCRAYVIKAFALDDWLATISQLLFIIFCSYEITGVHYGTGQHIVNLDADAIPKAMQMWWTCEPLYVLCNMFIKASIGLFLLRICNTTIHRCVVYTVLALTEVYSFFFFLLFVLQCRPTSLFWLRYSAAPPDGYCLDAHVVAKSFYGYSAISCLTDWTFSILPVFLVWSLQMDVRLKISVVGILAAGVIASSATIVRFPYLWSLTDIDDFLYSTSNVAMWSTVETGLGITAAGVATLRPLLRTFFGGSSANPSGPSGAGQWRKTGSNAPRGTGHRGGTENGFDLHDRSGGKGMGVTTIIDYGTDNEHSPSGRKGSGGKVRADDDSDENPFAGGADDSDRSEGGGYEGGADQWNITVKQSVVQTTSNV